MGLAKRGTVTRYDQTGKGIPEEQLRQPHSGKQMRLVIIGNEKQRVIVTNRSAVEQYEFSGEQKFILISIRDPDREPAIIKDKKCLDSIFISFFDIDIDAGFKSINPQQAVEIADFVTITHPDFPLIVCQCEAGVSSR